MVALLYDFKSLTRCVKSLMNVGEIGEWKKMKAKRAVKSPLNSEELRLFFFLINTRASPQLSHPQSKSHPQTKVQRVDDECENCARLLWLKQFLCISREITLSASTLQQYYIQFLLLNLHWLQHWIWGDMKTVVLYDDGILQVAKKAEIIFAFNQHLSAAACTTSTRHLSTLELLRTKWKISSAEWKLF